MDPRRIGWDCRAVIRSVLTLLFWIIFTPLAALIGFPWTFISGKVDFLYRIAIWGTRTGVRMAGVRTQTVGLDRLDRRGAYIYMSNHVSNLDPPLLLPAIPQRTSVMAKRELFRIPLLGRAMRMASLVPIDRSNKEAAIASVRAAGEVLRSGISMVVFPEGTRSPDGRLLPFKKGPFYMAMETGVAIVPVTIVGTEKMLPKGKSFVRPGTASVIFHPPIEAAGFNDRDMLVNAVRNAIASALPPERH